MKERFSFSRLIVGTGLPVLFFLAAWEVVRLLIIWWGGGWRRDLAFGIGLHYGFILFCVLSVINGVLQTAPLKLWQKMCAAGACFGVFAAFFLPSLPWSPYRVGSLLTIAAVGLLLPVMLSKLEE